MTAATFAAVVAGDSDERIVASDAHHVAFLAPEPQQPGHVIVATRRIVDYLFDLPAAEQAALWAFVHGVAARMRDRLPCERVCVAVIGWAVRHVHVHLVPTTRAGQMPPLGGPRLPSEQAAALAARLRT